MKRKILSIAALGIAVAVVSVIATPLVTQGRVTNPISKYSTLTVGTLIISTITYQDEPIYVGNGSVSSTINGSSTSTFPYGATFATSGGNVGIGTASPNAKLEVVGSVSSTYLSSYGDLMVGRTATTTITAGTRGNATSTFYSDVWVAYRDMLIGGSPLSGNLWIGNGIATSTIVAGLPGYATSTLEGDTVIANLHSGMLQFSDDGGVVDAMNIPVSASAATGTIEGYTANIDSRPLVYFTGISDGLGTVWGGRVGIGTATPSSTLHIGRDFMTTNNTATSTITIGTDRMSPGCIQIQDTDRLGWTYCSALNGTLSCSSSVTCE